MRSITKKYPIVVYCSPYISYYTFISIFIIWAQFRIGFQYLKTQFRCDTYKADDEERAFQMEEFSNSEAQVHYYHCHFIDNTVHDKIHFFRLCVSF